MCVGVFSRIGWRMELLLASSGSECERLAMRVSKWLTLADRISVFSVTIQFSLVEDKEWFFDNVCLWHSKLINHMDQ